MGYHLNSKQRKSHHGLFIAGQAAGFQKIERRKWAYHTVKDHSIAITSQVWKTEDFLHSNGHSVIPWPELGDDIFLEWQI